MQWNAVLFHFIALNFLNHRFFKISMWKFVKKILDHFWPPFPTIIVNRILRICKIGLGKSPSCNMCSYYILVKSRAFRAPPFVLYYQFSAHMCQVKAEKGRKVNRQGRPTTALLVTSKFLELPSRKTTANQNWEKWRQFAFYQWNRISDDSYKNLSSPGAVSEH